MVVLIVFFILQAVGIILTPFGLPGPLIQALAAAMLAAATDGARIGWRWVGLFVLLALLGEGADIVSGQWGTRRFGGSKKAAWGAFIGGFAGATFGSLVIPIFLIGPAIMYFVGTFAGAIVGEMQHQKELEPSLRAGIGAVLGRALGIAAKLGVGFVILALSIVIVW